MIQKQIIHGDASDDSDIYKEEVKHSFEEELEQPAIGSKSYLNKIEHIYVTFMNMNTKEVIERLYSQNYDTTDRKRFLSRKLVQFGLCGKIAGKSMNEMKHNKWKNIMASQNLIVFNKSKGEISKEEINY